MKKRRKLRRNDPCWCGSGRTFKKCHLRRAQEKSSNPFEASKRMAAVNRRPTCLHPGAPDECSEDTIRAHTIQRSGSLSRIAENRHVLGFSANLAELRRTNGKIAVKQIGINRASTFSGFCGYHDNMTFAPVEDQPFTATEEQCFLLGYRAMCRELYQKQAAIEALDNHLRLMDQGCPIEEQVALQAFLNVVQRGQVAGHRRLLEYKSDFDRILLKRLYSEVSNYVIFTEHTPDVMTSFGVTVQYDFHGNELQNLADVDQPLDSIYVSILATESGGAFSFVWRDSHTGACTKFMQSLVTLPDVDISDAIIRLVFEHSENTFFRPSWWNALPEPTQCALINRITDAAHFNKPRVPECLMCDGKHYADWKVLRRKTNRQL